MDRKEDGLQALGAKTTYRMDYAPEVLETFVNKHPGNDYWVRFNCPEFTSLCPITGQPDFAEIRISYIPDVKMVESKSLKLYLFSFRNHGDFHEDCVNIIMKDLIKLMDPKYIEVTGIFTPRGGISIWPYAQLWQARHQIRETGRAEIRYSRIKNKKPRKIAFMHLPRFLLLIADEIMGTEDNPRSEACASQGTPCHPPEPHPSYNRASWHRQPTPEYQPDHPVRHSSQP